MGIRGFRWPIEHSIMMFRDSNAVLGSRRRHQVRPSGRVPSLRGSKKTLHEFGIVAITPNFSMVSRCRRTGNIDGVPIPLGIRRMTEGFLLTFLASKGEWILSHWGVCRNRSHSPMAEETKFGIGKPRRQRMLGKRSKLRQKQLCHSESRILSSQSLFGATNERLAFGGRQWASRTNLDLDLLVSFDRRCCQDVINQNNPREML